MAKKERRRAAGGRIILWGALALIALVAYEFHIRMDVMGWALRGLYNYCVNEHQSFARALSYFDPSMFYLTAYLLSIILYGLAAIVWRGRRVAQYFLFLFTVAIALAGGKWFSLFDVSLINWAVSAKLIPLTMIAVGCVINMVGFRRRRGKRPDWDQVYEDEGMERGGPRGEDVRREVGRSKRDKRYQSVGI